MVRVKRWGSSEWKVVQKLEMLPVETSTPPKQNTQLKSLLGQDHPAAVEATNVTSVHASVQYRSEPNAKYRGEHLGRLARNREPRPRIRDFADYGSPEFPVTKKSVAAHLQPRTSTRRMSRTGNRRTRSAWRSKSGKWYTVAEFYTASCLSNVK
jgi:hypothetical protein